VDHVCCWGTSVIWVVYSVISCREACGFFFFLIWFKVAIEAAVRHAFHSVVWDLILEMNLMVSVFFTLLSLSP
jgi:hypothetical protein